MHTTYCNAMEAFQRRLLAKNGAKRSDQCGFRGFVVDTLCSLAIFASVYAFLKLLYTALAIVCIAMRLWNRGPADVTEPQAVRELVGHVYAPVILGLRCMRYCPHLSILLKHGPL